MLLLLLQTAVSKRKFARTQNPKDLQAAKDMTKEEFRWNFWKMLWALHYKLQQNGMSMASFQPWFSFDHNFAQDYADLRFTPGVLPPGCEYVPGYDFTKVRVPLPKYSPDCHRVIEHIFGQLSFKLHREMYRRGSQLNSTEAIAKYVVQQFYSLSANSMQKDADGLPALYDWIIEHQGAWPPRRMR